MTSAVNDGDGRLSHVAVIMDGNGRWAQRRRLPRTDGHRRGLGAARRLIENAVRLNINTLTLFAFSNENWRRSPEEVNALFSLFSSALVDAGDLLRKNDIRLNFIGDIRRFPSPLRTGMAAAERSTKDGGRLFLNLALGYSGRWDILQAAEKLAADNRAATEENFEQCLSTAGTPPPDLLIRTGGESRLSNFMLWQAAYTELYFTDTLWPDFGDEDLSAALADFERRERRFGRVIDEEPPAAAAAAVLSGGAR